MDTLRFRQVHLDFHNHGDIKDIGAKFDKVRFQQGLLEAAVDSITCFSKCAHGYSYHDSRVGVRHPHMKDELLPRQIEACREVGIKVPIYLSAGIDEVVADAHPEWVLQDRQGRVLPHGDALKPGYRLLRLASGYLDYLCLQVEEVVDRWPDADGIFMDIIMPMPDYSPGSLAEMKRWGLNPESDIEMQDYVQRCILRYYDRINQVARKNRPDLPIFHNSGHITVGAHEAISRNSHLELESLPTGGWGYDHFPLSARYAATTGLSYLGMTGKFHTTWGEFGGYKRPAALRYECLSMLAHGARCSIGDQLHPGGELNHDTYRLIGEAYQAVKAAEPWCAESRLVAEIGLLSADRSHGRLHLNTGVALEDEGVSRMLLEAHLPFIVLDQEADWSSYKVVILPDSIQLTPTLQARAVEFLAAGGKILASGESLLNDAKDGFVLDAGIRLEGRSTFDPDYLEATGLSEGIEVHSPVVIHGGALDVVAESAEVFLHRRDPCFNRTWAHFSSHQHSPDERLSAFPGATVTSQIAYFAHRIFSRYRLYGQPLYRDYVCSALRHLLGGCLPIESNLPSTARLSVSHQEMERRFVLHVLHATPVLKGSATGPDAKLLEVIEEALPLHNVWIEVDLPKAVCEARLVPGGEKTNCEMVSHNRYRLHLSRVETHQMVELSY